MNKMIYQACSSEPAFELSAVEVFVHPETLVVDQ